MRTDGKTGARHLRYWALSSFCGLVVALLTIQVFSTEGGSPEEDFDHLYQQGEDLYRQGRLQEAAQSFQRSLELLRRPETNTRTAQTPALDRKNLQPLLPLQEPPAFLEPMSPAVFQRQRPLPQGGFSYPEPPPFQGQAASDRGEGSVLALIRAQSDARARAEEVQYLTKLLDEANRRLHQMEQDQVERKQEVEKLEARIAQEMEASQAARLAQGRLEAELVSSRQNQETLLKALTQMQIARAAEEESLMDRIAQLEEQLKRARISLSQRGLDRSIEHQAALLRAEATTTHMNQKVQESQKLLSEKTQELVAARAQLHEREEAIRRLTLRGAPQAVAPQRAVPPQVQPMEAYLAQVREGLGQSKPIQAPVASPQTALVQSPAGSDFAQVKVFLVGDRKDFLILSITGVQWVKPGAVLVLFSGDQPVLEAELAGVDETGLALAYILREFNPVSTVQEGDYLSAQQLLPIGQ